MSGLSFLVFAVIDWTGASIVVRWLMIFVVVKWSVGAGSQERCYGHGIARTVLEMERLFGEPGEEAFEEALSGSWWRALSKAVLRFVACFQLNEKLNGEQNERKSRPQMEVGQAIDGCELERSMLNVIFTRQLE
jgi:hypothetical protein